MNCKKILGFILCFSLLIGTSLAETCNCPPPQDKIILQLQSESWAKTTTANVSINIDGVLDKLTVSQVRDEMMHKLTKISDGDWQISSFSQTQNVSGLEEVHAVAELRMPQSSLSSLQSQVKDTSRPGLNFKVANIDFSPSFDDIQNTQGSLREKIYNLVTAEIQRLEKVYPGRKFAIHAVNFIPGFFTMPVPESDNYMMRNIKAMAAPMVGGALNVGTKVHMDAIIELLIKP